ncbi:hypothetical protein SARI_03182 [Salmonella enterica subsp. arizonae serovar 62:z4,z23:-]|uniref:Uncharacterized protein n=1 Tax=Salmonella arizonae (strain ATCC BAA-731 / CDC346-86 / RSK2980) TaxID=41514 RepID=A9MEV3_SALAR|nr:hypothetical protein SARI_03182 [Salmonella enterica subsp. arizonae serovar 62:z4,z23:-]
MRWRKIDKSKGSVAVAFFVYTSILQAAAALAASYSAHLWASPFQGQRKGCSKG